MSQNEADLKRLADVVDALKSSYVGGKPLHVAAPDKSVFRVCTSSEFNELGDAKVQQILQSRHILVTGIEGPEVTFDLEALSELRLLSTVDTIQGMC